MIRADVILLLRLWHGLFESQTLKHQQASCDRPKHLFCAAHNELVLFKRLASQSIVKSFVDAWIGRGGAKGKGTEAGGIREKPAGAR